MPGQFQAPSLVFASAGATSSSSAICSVSARSFVFHASGPNVIVVNTSPQTSRVDAVLPTYPGARVAGVAAAADADSRSPILVSAALSDGSLVVWAGRCGVWSTPTVIPATGGGGRKTATPLVSLCALYSKLSDEYIVVTAAMDDANGAGLCVVWAVDGVGSDAVLSLKSVAKTSRTPDYLLPECIAGTLACGKLLVALGGTDRIVRLYERQGSLLVPLTAVLKGHRDWVRGLCFSEPLEPMGPTSESSFLLATASTDATVRVWKFCRVPEGAPGLTEESRDALVIGDDANRAQVDFLLAGRYWSATLDALLSEHQGPVLSVCFSNDSKCCTLMSASMDGSVGVWRPSSEKSPTTDPLNAQAPSRWPLVARFGLLGGTAAIALGFAGVVFASPGVDRIVAHTLAGSLFSWREAKSIGSGLSGDALAEDESQFVAESAPGGHAGPVSSVAWDPQGRYLMSCGEDKTTRVYVPLVSGSNQFVECARPQVHGHPVRGVEFLSSDGRSFVSIAEEKVLRLFDAPNQFVVPGSDRKTPSTGGDAEDHIFSTEAIAAAVPELGLSNKALYQDQTGRTGQVGEARPDAAVDVADDSCDDEDGPVAPFDISGGADAEMTSFGATKAAGGAPLEVELRQHRLWPERAKLYGHGNDVSCIAVDLRHGILASASRAQAGRDAAIILWNISTGVEMARLLAHDLTVNQLQFSPDGTALLSVSRDRSFAVFRNLSAGSDPFSFVRVAREVESHGRLVHAGCWMHGTSLIVTGSRDRFLKIWKFPSNVTDEGSQPMEVKAEEVYREKFSTGVSALAATSRDSTGPRNLLAFGREDGSISVARVDWDGKLGTMCLNVTIRLSAALQCCGRVSRLAWQPLPDREDDEQSGRRDSNSGRFLAACSEDHSTRIYCVSID